MKLLLIHTDHIEYEALKPAGNFAEEIDDEHKTGRLEEALAVFIAVEKVDEAEPGLAVAQAADQIREVAGMVKTGRIMLYPYAHLSSNLGSPKSAKSILADLEATIQDEFETQRSPFGWYKRFTLTCKGHPLSELSREVVPGQPGAQAATAPAPAAKAAPAEPAAGEEEGRVSQALAKESQLTSTWYVLTPAGDLIEADDFDFGQHAGLKKFYAYESQKERAAKQEAPHIRLMQELELVDYESGSDSGNFRWYPKGQLIKRLLEEHVRRICARHGAMQVETPIMYDIEHPALNKYLNRFPARQYRIKTEDKEFFLRFAACFGQYMILHDATFSYKHLPLRLLEITHYSFRREQRGELTGIKRLRAFTMPDMHTICTDIEQARDEFGAQFDLTQQWMDDLELDYEVGIRIVRDFYDENQEFYVDLAKKADRPVLIEMWNERFFYFVTKFELNVNDALDKAAALSTVQIDVENAERFGIEYTAWDGSRKHPHILHASISGSIDRCLYTLLEAQHQAAKQGQKPMLPFWLSPVQIRLMSLKTPYVEACQKLRQEILDAAGFDLRIEIDDREESVGRKIRDAEKDWVPLVIVIGDREAESGVYAPRFRQPRVAEAAGFDPEKKDFNVQDLVKLATHHTEGRPTLPEALPVLMTMQPTFRG